MRASDAVMDEYGRLIHPSALNEVPENKKVQNLKIFSERGVPGGLVRKPNTATFLKAGIWNYVETKWGSTGTTKWGDTSGLR